MDSVTYGLLAFFDDAYPHYLDAAIGADDWDDMVWGDDWSDDYDYDEED